MDPSKVSGPSAPERVAVVIVAAAWILQLVAVEVRTHKRAMQRRKHSPFKARDLLTIAAGVISLVVTLTLVARRAFPVAGPMWIWLGVGVVMVAAGVAIRWRSVAVNPSFNLLRQAVPGQELATQGPYRCIRHPGYAALLLNLAGTAFVLRSWGLIALVLLAAGALVARIVIEERELVDATGEEYLAYRQRTPWRLIPHVW
jgi:protein-S-isoprenylcysteine O-methyltransferase Ste14